MNVTLEQFLGTLLYAPVEAHILHLKTHGYSKHMALDDFYKEAPDKADEIAEQTFGHIDPIQEYVNVLSYRDYADPVSYLEALRQFIVESRKIIYNPEKHSNIYSAIDDYLSLIDSTTYKLAQLYEGLDSIDFNQSEAQKQYIAGTLTYGGKNVRRFFDDNAAKISAIVSISSTPSVEISSSLPRNGDTYVAPALAARRAWLDVKIRVTFVLIPSEESTLHALSPSTVMGIFTTMFG